VCDGDEDRINVHCEVGRVCVHGTKRGQITVVVLPCTGGKAEDIGETCATLLSSVITDAGAVVLGVAGALDTFPMNHDC
jgi:hypothetical protein